MAESTLPKVSAETVKELKELLEVIGKFTTYVTRAVAAGESSDNNKIDVNMRDELEAFQKNLNTKTRNWYEVLKSKDIEKFQHPETTLKYLDNVIKGAKDLYDLAFKECTH